MKNNVWFYIACVLFFLVGYNINNVAVSFPKYKVAVVDISQVLEKSSDLHELKASQEKQMQELNTIISKAQNEIANISDTSKIPELEANYRKQIEEKKIAIDQDYNNKIVKITAKIKSMVSNEAKKSNYNLVLPTGMVISGGEDITQNIIKSMK